MRLKDVMTTGDVAKLCCVSQTQVRRWSDKGVIKCFIVPGSMHRRFTKVAVMAFLTKHGMESLLTYPEVK